MKRNSDDITFQGVSASLLVVEFLETFGFITLLSKQKQSRFTHTPCFV